MSNDKLEQMINSASDAVSKTLNNGFDVIKTAQELNDKYGKDSDNKK